MKWCVSFFVLVLIGCIFASTSSPAVASPADAVVSIDMADAGSYVMLAQDDSNSSSSNSSHVSGRGMRKLIGLAIAVVIGLGSFILKMFRGGDS
jgi:hypothetical protein